MIKKITCIVCPNGCEIEIDGDNIRGYTCKRVKTSLPIPKEEIFNVMKEINKQELDKPIFLHQIVIKNVLNLGVDIITTKEIK